jgi:heavy metal sensor kinase
VGVLEVADNISRIQDTLDRVFLYMKVAIPLVLGLAAVLGWFLTGRSLAPVADIRRLASEISVSDLSKRLHIEGDDEIAQLAATFDGMIDRLEQAFVRQKQFTSDASHELRTPLAVMQADFSLALRRRRTVAEYENVLESAQEEIARMSAIVEDLSLLARMDNSKMVLNMRPVRLDHLLADLVGRMDVLAADQRIVLVARDLFPLTIHADERLLKQLVVNLLNNAIAYTAPRGRVEVRMIPISKSEVAFHVRDTGVGIPEAALPHIFERFYRVDASRQRNPGGSGLGLAICQSIATAHGGSIGAYSVEGQGSTFTVVLPVAGPGAGTVSAARENGDDAAAALGKADAMPGQAAVAAGS